MQSFDVDISNEEKKPEQGIERGYRQYRKKNSFIAFANGIPRFRTGRGIKKALQAQLKPYGCFKISVDHNSEGHARGFAWLYFKSSEQRDKCCIEMDGRLRIPIQVSKDSSTHSTPIETVAEYTSLRVKACIDIKKCHSFPQATQIQQLALRLDHEALFSVTDYYTAMDMTEVIGCFLKVFRNSGSDTQSKYVESSIAIDCTAGAGGNTIAFIESKLFREVKAFEINSNRCNDLRNNIEVLFGRGISNELQCRWTVQNDDVVSTIISPDSMNAVPLTAMEEYDLLFFDPPWGGLDYHQAMHADASSPRFPYDYNLPCLIEEQNAPENDSFPNVRSLSHILGHIFTFGGMGKRVKLAAVKVPSEFDASMFFARITAPGSWEKEQPSKSTRPAIDCRPHPFRFQFGVRTALLVVAYPPYFRNSDLTAIMKQLAELDKSHGFELHPRFYDWETNSWISSRRWHGP